MTWLLLTWKTPAVYLQNGVCVPPKSGAQLRQLKIPVNDIGVAPEKNG